MTPSKPPEPVTIDPRPAGEWGSLCPVYRITPEDGFYIHRFFDTPPWSPSGRYIAALRLPFQDREPRPGEAAEVCVIDLHEHTLRRIGETRAWSIQMGAQQQWGPCDRFLYYNDIRDGEAVCIRYDLEEGEAFATGGPLYQVTPDGRHAISPDLAEIRASQAGYGIATAAGGGPRLSPGAGDRALWRTDLETGKREEIVRYEELCRHLPDLEGFRGCAFVGFHVKMNAAGDRLLFVLRAMDTEGRHGRLKRRPNLLTLRPDGTGITVAMPYSTWSRGGHHPNWHPDGRRCSMNLKLDGETMRIVEFHHDGSGLRALFDDIPGSGHPSFSPDGRFIITDAYVSDEHVRARGGSVPLRLIDVERGSCAAVTWIPVQKAGRGALRCDPHPAWSRDGAWVCFNGAPGGRRQLFVADLRPLLDARHGRRDVPGDG